MNSLWKAAAKLVLPGVCFVRHLRAQRGEYENSAILTCYTMLTFDVLHLSDAEIEQMPRWQRWKVIDTAEQRIKANEHLQETLQQLTIVDRSLTDEIMKLKVVKFRVWWSLTPKFKKQVRIGFTPANF